MSAIAGYWCRRGASADRACGQILNAIPLRTAECTQTWTDGDISLGRRLVTTVPEDRFDEQPVPSPSGRYILAADLRVDDRADLARALGVAPTDLARMADSALAACALDRWSEDAFERLVGVFAIAAWDRKERRLLLARDFLGGRPLFYHNSANAFAFASMPSGLHTLPEAPKAPDLESMAEALALIAPRHTRSAYLGIDRVMPGHYVIVPEAGEPRIFHYWRPNLEPLRFKRHEDYVEGLRHHLDQAVEAQLRGADGRVAAHLSAGYDSSAVATSAALIMGARGGTVTAFTAAPREGYAGPGGGFRGVFDEAPVAAETAALHPNLEHVVVRPAQRSAFGDLQRASTIYGMPMFNLFNLAWVEAINDAARARGLKILLTGGMGNASLSYSGRAALPELFSAGRFGEWFLLGRALRRSRASRWRGVVWNTAAPWAPGRAASRVARLVGHRGLEPSRFSALRPGLVERIYTKAAATAPASQPLAQQSFDVWDRPFRDGQLERLAMLAGDYGSIDKGVLAWWGIDTRDPTADRRLMEFSLRIPTEAFIHEGTPKALIRKVLAGRVARAVIEPVGRGQQAADWHEDLSEARERLREELELIEESPEACALIDVERLRGLIDNWPAEGWGTADVIADYRLSLARAVSVANFMRRASNSNR